ncbi:MAG: cbb3-type cytochrome c oxidase subunit II [Acidimicrobiia bacterium]
MAELSEVAEKLGVPERLIERSASARASAEGVPVEEVLDAWLEGGAIETGVAPAAVEERLPEEEAPEFEEEVVEEEEAVPVGAAAPVAQAPPVQRPAPAPVGRPPRPTGPPPLREPERSDNPRFVLAGALSLFALGLVMTVVLPILEAAQARPTELAATWRNYPALSSGEASPTLAEAGLDPELVAGGRRIYVTEGCWYCHTQQVRPIITDAGLGPVTRPGDLVFERPHLLGSQRIGPDLMHVGAREPTDQVEFVKAYLIDPQAERRYSSMPPYGHLSDQDLTALAQYLVSLKGSLPEEEEGDEGESTTTTTAPAG